MEPDEHGVYSFGGDRDLRWEEDFHRALARIEVLNKEWPRTGPKASVRKLEKMWSLPTKEC